MALPKEVKGILREPLKFGYTLEKRRKGDGITLVLVSPTGLSMMNVPQTAKYPNRLRAFKNKVANLPFNEMYLRAPEDIDALLNDVSVNGEQHVVTITAEPEAVEPIVDAILETEWVTTQEAAKLIGVSTSYTAALMAKGKLTPKETPRRGQMTLISVESIKNYLATRQPHGRTERRPGPVRVTQVEPETEMGKFRFSMKAITTKIVQRNQLDLEIKAMLDNLLEKHEEVIKERDAIAAKHDKTLKHLGRAVDEGV